MNYRYPQPVNLYFGWGPAHAIEFDFRFASTGGYLMLAEERVERADLFKDLESGLRNCLVSVNYFMREEEWRTPVTVAMRDDIPSVLVECDDGCHRWFPWFAITKRIATPKSQQSAVQFIPGADIRKRRRDAHKIIENDSPTYVIPDAVQEEPW